MPSISSQRQDWSSFQGPRYDLPTKPSDIARSNVGQRMDVMSKFENASISACAACLGEDPSSDFPHLAKNLAARMRETCDEVLNTIEIQDGSALYSRRLQRAKQWYDAEVDTWALAEFLYCPREAALPSYLSAEAYESQDSTSENLLNQAAVRIPIQHTAASSDDMVDDLEEKKSVLPPTFSQSDRFKAEQLFRGEDWLQRIQFCVEWLEDCYANRELRPQLPDVERIDFRRTVRDIENVSVMLDPDAQSRHSQSHRAPDDIESQARLLCTLFRLIRGGRVDVACQLAREMGEHWRAATFAGSALAHDYLGTEELATYCSSIAPAFGNARRRIWREMTTNLCRDASRSRDQRGVSGAGAKPIEWTRSAFEAALYGSFAGMVEDVLPVCETWEDALWVHLKSTVDRYICQEIGHTAEKTDSTVSSGEQVAVTSPESVSISIDDAVLAAQNLTRPPAEIMQAQVLMILGHEQELLSTLYEWSRDSHGSEHLHRFCAHLALLLRGLPQYEDDAEFNDKCESVIASYCCRIIEVCDIGHLRFLQYCLRMDKLLVKTYVRYLQRIVDPVSRRRCLEEASPLVGGRLTEITQTLSSTVYDQRFCSDDVGVNDERNEATEAAERKISAVQWLFIVPDQHVDALRAANKLLCEFCVSVVTEAPALGENSFAPFSTGDNLRHAHQLLSDIPQDCIDAVRRSHAEAESEEDRERIGFVLHEYESWKEFIKAIDQFMRWLTHHSKPPLPPLQPSGPPNEGNTFAHDLSWQGEQKRYRSNLLAWQDDACAKTNAADSAFSTLLRFPMGWLLATTTVRGEAIPPNEINRLRSARSICVPHIVDLWYYLLFEEKRFSACLAIADLIADEEKGLHKAFQPNQLKHFLDLMRRSAIGAWSVGDTWIFERKQAS